MAILLGLENITEDTLGRMARRQIDTPLKNNFAFGKPARIHASL
jgi:hypothetical protein